MTVVTNVAHWDRVDMIDEVPQRRQYVAYLKRRVPPEGIGQLST